jgi:hypothetical protein
MANTITTLTHPAGQTGHDATTSGVAPKTVIGSVTGTVYTVTSNAISSCDVRDAAQLIIEGWA